jgi:hypothetical protein
MSTAGDTFEKVEERGKEASTRFVKQAVPPASRAG